MAAKRRALVDSSVIISSLISKKGAAYFLINHKLPATEFYISTLPFKEQKIVAKRLKIDNRKLQNLVKKRLKIIKIKQSKRYQAYVTDVNDAHIIAAAQKVKAKFLITYNQRHFKREKIKRDLNIITFTPAQLLQYLRSQN